MVTKIYRLMCNTKKNELLKCYVNKKRIECARNRANIFVRTNYEHKLKNKRYVCLSNHPCAKAFSGPGHTYKPGRYRVACIGRRRRSTSPLDRQPERQPFDRSSTRHCPSAGAPTLNSTVTTA